MAIVSQSLPTPEWIFPTITNNYEARVAGRKRGLDPEWEGEKQGQMDTQFPHKKAKTVGRPKRASDTLNTNNDAFLDEEAPADARAPHEFLAGAGDWKFEPVCSDSIPDEIQLEENTPTQPVDVEKVIAILLQALNSQNTVESEHDSPVGLAYQQPPTSPLSDSPDRVPFVRKAVGGSCHGKVDSGLQRWVLCKNHYNDVRSLHPSRRSSEWIEALHEMGWENLHPTYMSQSQQTFKTLSAFSHSWDDWIDVEEQGVEHSSEGSESGEEDGERDLEGIHEDVWNLGTPMPLPSHRNTPIVA